MSGFPDAGRVLRAVLEPVVGAGSVVSQRPGDLSSRLPLVHAYRFGGSDDGVFDAPSCSVDVYAVTHAQGFALAERCREAMLAAPTRGDGLAAAVDDVTTVSGPVEVEYPGDGVRMWASTYRLSMRRMGA